jgi:hypothetical protein
MSETTFPQTGNTAPLPNSPEAVNETIGGLTHTLIGLDKALRDARGDTGKHLENDAQLNSFPGGFDTEAPALTFSGYTSPRVSSEAESTTWRVHLYADPTQAGGRGYSDMSVGLVAHADGSEPTTEVKIDPDTAKRMIGANLEVAEQHLVKVSGWMRAPYTPSDQATTASIRTTLGEYMTREDGPQQGWRQKNFADVIDPLLAVNDFLETVQTGQQGADELSVAAATLQAALVPTMSPNPRG